jgi:hypothetical protein
MSCCCFNKPYKGSICRMCQKHTIHNITWTIDSDYKKGVGQWPCTGFFFRSWHWFGQQLNKTLFAPLKFKYFGKDFFFFLPRIYMACWFISGHARITYIFQIAHYFWILTPGTSCIRRVYRSSTSFWFPLLGVTAHARLSFTVSSLPEFRVEVFRWYLGHARITYIFQIAHYFWILTL